MLRPFPSPPDSLFLSFPFSPFALFPSYTLLCHSDLTAGHYRGRHLLLSSLSSSPGVGPSWTTSR